MAECRNIALKPHSRDEITQGALRASHFWGSRTDNDRMGTTWIVQIRTVIASEWGGLKYTCKFSNSEKCKGDQRTNDEQKAIGLS